MHNSPPEASGHPAEFALDNNLDTYWKSTGTANVEVQVDLGEAKTVGAMLLFIRNYKEISSGTVPYYWSDNGSAWTYAGSWPLTYTLSPIRIATSGLGSSHRYWKIIITSPSHVVELASTWWGSYYYIAQGNVLPQEDGDHFHNRVGVLSGGRVAAIGINRNYVENPSRRYLVKAGTPYSNLLNAFRDSRGIRHLLIVNEGPAQSYARVVRFADNILPRPVIGYGGLREIKIDLRGAPYIDDGETS